MNRIESGTEMAKVMADFVNISYDGDVKDFVEEMSIQHRTLQQGFTKLVIQWLEHLATLNENWCDLRNEASVKFAKQVIGRVDAEARMLPHV